MKTVSKLPYYQHVYKHFKQLFIIGWRSQMLITLLDIHAEFPTVP